MITKEQIKLIHTSRNRAKIGDSKYREMLQTRFGVSSSKELSKSQAKEFIKILQREFKTENGATDKQIGRLKALYNSMYTNNINVYIESNCGKGKKIDNITKKEASKLIYMLEEVEAWKKRKKKL